ncbi:MAG: hypothetical protein Kow0090_12960 [Myxococcota bacterium]
MKTKIFLSISLAAAFADFATAQQTPAGVPAPYKRQFESRDVEAFEEVAPPSGVLIQHPVPQPQDALNQEFKSRCKCAAELGMGGPIFGTLFKTYKNDFGELNAPKMLVGGRGFGYLLDGRLRLGGGGAAILAYEGNKETISGEAGGITYAKSEGRSLAGGYGGFIAQYVLSIGDYVRIPLGTLVGFGGGGFTSTLFEIVDKEVYQIYTEGGAFIALQPILEVQALITDRVAVSLAGTYLHAEVLGDTGNLGGFGFFVGLDFGRFRPLEF